MRPVIPLVLLWVLTGELAALGVAGLWPRYVFPVGLESPWPALAGLAIVLAISKREERALALDRVRAHFVEHRRVLLVVAAAMAVTTVVVTTLCPAGVDVEMEQPDGAHIALGRRPDFDLDRQEVLRLAATPGAHIHAKGYLVPGWTAPWAARAKNQLARVFVLGHGTVALRLGPHVLVEYDDRGSLQDGLVQVAYLEPQGGRVDLRFEPGDRFADGRFRVGLEDTRLTLHLFAEPVSRSAFWLVSLERVALWAFLVAALPAAFVLLLSTSHALMGRRRAMLLEALVVLVAGAMYFAALAPRVQNSASGDAGAFLAWPDYIVRDELVQNAPAWARSWAKDRAAAYVSLALHVSPPPSTHPAPGPEPELRMPRLVNAKPIGLPLVLLALRAMTGVESEYYGSAVLAALAVMALYGACRASGLGVVLSTVGAASLGLSGEFVHSATVLDPDAAATCWLAVLLLSLFCLKRSRAWAVMGGAALGFACITRYNLAIAAVLAMPFVVRNPRRIPFFVAGGAPFAVLFVVVNVSLYGGPFELPYTTYATVLMSRAQPYFRELAGYVSAFVSDASPFAWLPFLVLPFVRGVPAFLRAALGLFVVAWVGFFARFAKVDAHFLRYLLPAYPAIFLGALQVWNELAGTAPLRRFATIGACVFGNAGWLLPNGLPEDPEPFDQSRVAVAWVEHLVPPRAALLVDNVWNIAVYHYTDHRRFPITLQAPRVPLVDLARLRAAAVAGGDTDDWYLLLQSFELETFRSAYPELGLAPVRAGAGWTLFRVTAIGEPPEPG